MMTQRKPIFVGVDMAKERDKGAAIIRQGACVVASMQTDASPEIDRGWINGLNAARKDNREALAMVLRMLAEIRGASVELQHSEANPGYCGQGIDLRIACKGVGAMVDIDDLHGGEWVLIHWFGTEHKGRNFTSRFGTVVGSGGNGRPHHKATSHPRDWYSLAMMLDGGLQLAARGEAFDEPSAT